MICCRNLIFSKLHLEGVTFITLLWIKILYVTSFVYYNKFNWTCIMKHDQIQFLNKIRPLKRVLYGRGLPYKIICKICLYDLWIAHYWLIFTHVGNRTPEIYHLHILPWERWEIIIPNIQDFKQSLSCSKKAY